MTTQDAEAPATVMTNSEPEVPLAEQIAAFRRMLDVLKHHTVFEDVISPLYQPSLYAAFGTLGAISRIEAERDQAIAEMKRAQMQRDKHRLAQMAAVANLRDCGAAFRMIRDAITELSPSVGPLRERDVGPPDYKVDAEEIIDGFQRALDAARMELTEAQAEIARLLPGRGRYRHKKRGSTYQVIGHADLQASGLIREGGEALVIYRAEADGSLWARPEGEFNDGRFEVLPGESRTPPPEDAIEAAKPLKAVESKEDTHNRFYKAFHAWFMSDESACDFWSECDAPEQLASIAVELCDEFAVRAITADRARYQELVEAVIKARECGMASTRPDVVKRMFDALDKLGDRE